MTLEKGSSSRKEPKTAHDILKPDIPKTQDIFNKQRERWTKADYEAAMSQLSDSLMEFNISIPRRTIVSPAFLALSGRAVKLLIACLNVAWRSRTGGDVRNINKHTERLRYVYEPFMLPYNLAAAFGIGTKKQISQSFTELKSFGFIAQVGVSHYNRPNVYRISDEYLKHSKQDVLTIKKELKK